MKLMDKHEAGWVEALFTDGPLTPVAPTSSQGLQRYALFDCAFAPGCYEAILRSIDASLWRSLYREAPGANEVVLRHSPILLMVDAVERTVLEQLLGHTDALPMLSFLHSREPLEALYRRLGRWCMVDADGQYFVLRFPDTRRLRDILDVMTPQQVLEFCGPATVWHYRTREAAWEVFTAPDAPEPPIASALKGPVLNGDQFAALIVACEPDELVAGLLQLAPAYAERHSPSALHAIGVRSVELANALRLEAPELRVALCELLCEQPELASTSDRDIESLRALLKAGVRNQS